LFSFAAEKKPPATIRQVRNTRYEWLVRPYKANPLASLVEDFHPKRSDKLYLSHHEKNLMNPFLSN
jgi:hypothetical protein